MMKLLAVLVCAAILSACGKKEDPASPGGGGGASQPSGPKADFSSPKATVETMFAACKAKDAKMVGLCFSLNCEGEFKKVQAGTDPKVDKFFEVFATGKITDAPEVAKDAKAAEVKITFVEGGRDDKETINLVLEGSEWKIAGF